MRLVLVDDDPDFREAMCGELTEHGFSVAAFADGASALAHFGAGNQADVVVLDWRLKGASGLDVLNQLRRHGVMLPVIFLTGMPALNYESAALDHGALDFVDKARGADILAKRVRLIVEAGMQPPALPREEKVYRGKLVLRPRPRDWVRYHAGSLRGLYGQSREEIDAYVEELRRNEGREARVEGAWSGREPASEE